MKRVAFTLFESGFVTLKKKLFWNQYVLKTQTDRQTVKDRRGQTDKQVLKSWQVKWGRIDRPKMDRPKIILNT